MRLLLLPMTILALSAWSASPILARPHQNQQQSQQHQPSPQELARWASLMVPYLSKEAAVAPAPVSRDAMEEPAMALDDFRGANDKRQQFDDYGHMRFGKRDFDDYGHMRFGRSTHGSSTN